MAMEKLKIEKDKLTKEIKKLNWFWVLIFKEVWRESRVLDDDFKLCVG